MPAAALGDANIGAPPDVDLERRPPHHQHSPLASLQPQQPSRMQLPVTPPSSAPSSPHPSSAPSSPAPATAPLATPSAHDAKSMAPRPAPVAKPAAVGAVSDTDLKNQILKELKKPSKSATCLLPPFPLLLALTLFADYQDLFRMLAQLKGALSFCERSYKCQDPGKHS